MVHGNWLGRWATYAPEKMALVESASGRRFTYAALNDRTTRLAASLVSRYGVGPGDRVAVLAFNQVETLEVFFACGLLGAIMVPLNYRLAAPELAGILADCQPKALFFGAEYEEQAGVLLAGDGHLPACGAHGIPYAASTLRTCYDDLLADKGEVPAHDVIEADPWLILYTSGTTGVPKGAMLTHGSLTWNAVNTQVGWDLRHDDITLTHTPFFHTGGLNVLTTPLIHRGGTIVLDRQFEAGRTLELVAQERCTVVFAVPTMFHMMAEHQDFESTDLTSVRFFISGGAPCPLPLIDLYARHGLVFKQGYGLTEAGPNCFTLDARDAVKKAGSVGFPNMHVDVRVVDDDGKDVGPDAVGELLIRGPHVFAGYWRNPDASASAMRDGWLATGDLVRRDVEGYTYIVDRKKDMIISGGENIYPAELEQALHKHPAIAEAAVIGVPHAKWGETPLAVVSLRAGHTVDEAEVIAFLAARLARYKLPKKVAFVDALPRNATGKVNKLGLRNHNTGKAPAADRG